MISSETEKADLITAECLGASARDSNSHAKAPAQDVELMKLVAKHSKPLGQPSICLNLLEAWNRGYLLKNDQLAKEGASNPC